MLKHQHATALYKGTLERCTLTVNTMPQMSTACQHRRHHAFRRLLVYVFLPSSSSDGNQWSSSHTISLYIYRLSNLLKFFHYFDQFSVIHSNLSIVNKLIPIPINPNFHFKSTCSFVWPSFLLRPLRMSAEHPYLWTRKTSSLMVSCKFEDQKSIRLTFR